MRGAVEVDCVAADEDEVCWGGHGHVFEGHLVDGRRIFTASQLGSRRSSELERGWGYLVLIHCRVYIWYPQARLNSTTNLHGF